MNVDIAEILKGFIDTLPFVGKSGGLVRIAKIKSSTGETLTYPIGCNITHAECLSGQFKDLTPDSSYTSVFYFEDLQAIKLINCTGTYNEYESKLRLVGWLNKNKLGVTDCSISAKIISDIINVIPDSRFNSGDYKNIYIKFDSEEMKDSRIFSKYTYDEDFTQYLMHPYDYLALNFTITYRVPRSCSTGLTIGTEITCP